MLQKDPPIGTFCVSLNSQAFIFSQAWHKGDAGVLLLQPGRWTENSAGHPLLTFCRRMHLPELWLFFVISKYVGRGSLKYINIFFVCLNFLLIHLGMWTRDFPLYNQSMAYNGNWELMASAIISSFNFLRLPHVSQACLQLTTWWKMTLNFWSSYLCLPSARIIDMHHHTIYVVLR